MYADTIHPDSQGRRSTNFSPIPIEHVSGDASCGEQLIMVIEDTVRGLEAFIEEQSEKGVTDASG